MQNRFFTVQTQTPSFVKMHVLTGTTHVTDQVADDFMEWLNEHVGEGASREIESGSKPICIGLSGGRLARSLLLALATRLNKELANRSEFRDVMNRCHFFWADERAVGPEHPESNYRIAQECLFEATGIRRENIHRIRGELGMEMAAVHAESEFRNLFPNGVNGTDIPPMDLIFLGMGEDGHFASIFPGNSELEGQAREQCFYPVIGPKPPPERVTMSLRTLVEANHVWVVISGEQKYETFIEALSKNSQIPIATLVRRRPITDCYVDLSVAQ